ncbi:clasp N terminal-domain-containing protein [Chaetomium tenue]|uniref:Clasp N terminal-domain-containing protein n=1 Tax=Chaetomium tenue TaxID=1854479 RepID=A0ACB7P6T3_9PEZI|nr:clasp N terminal-domain-containing protein [Chaetomium globosum]
MSEIITDDQVANLIALLRTDVSIDTKVQQVTVVKSSIKQHMVPESCIVPVFEALHLASSSQHALLVNAGFTALNHLFTRLVRQDPRSLTKEGTRTLPLIVEKLGDQKEKFRQLASQALATLYKVAPVEVERSVRNIAMVGKNARAKEASLHWLLQMHQEQGLQFRAYVPTMMELLEDADGMVRDVAKSTVIELFRNAPGPAKSDLKKQLKNFKVRPAIEQAIVKELNPTSSAPASQPDRQEDHAPSRPTLAASVSSLAHRPVTPGLPEPPAESVEPSYVNTTRELDEIFREMHGYFEGKETEQNWLKREESVTKLRRLIAGNAATDFHDQFLTGLRALLDGMIKAVVSLRTSLSKEGCSLIQEIAKAYGPAMDPMVEILMQTFIKLTAATKKIASAQANTTVDTIISKVTYNNRIMQHVWLACQDKNVQPRLYASGWLRTLLAKEAHHKNHVEHTGGLDLIEKCIKKGLADANPGVREKMRATYWMFAGIWPAKAEAIMNGLDSTAARLLQNDPNNPKSPKKPEGGARPGLGLSKSTMGTSKPSVREAMMAQKRAMTTKAVPTRPGSAMSHFSPAKSVSSLSQAPPVAPTVRARPESVMGSTGGISGAPMRPGRRKVETARPATAGPYSVRSHDQPSAEQTSPPSRPKPKAVTPKSITSSPKRTAPKMARSATVSGEPQLPTPTRAGSPKVIGSPRATPSRSVQPTVVPPSSSPSKRHEDFSLVVPIMTSRASPPQEEQRFVKPVEDEDMDMSPSDTPSKLPQHTPDAPASPPQTVAAVHEEPISMATPLRGVEVAVPSPPSASRWLEVYEDPLTREQQTTPKLIFGPVLEDRSVNEDAAILQQAVRQQQEQQQQQQNGAANGMALSPEKLKQNQRLLDSGISKVQQKSLDVHGFRKLQGIIRDSDTKPTTGAALLSDDKFDALVAGLFDFLESPLTNLAPEKTQDVKAQVLATIKLLLKRTRASFQPHVSRGLESLLRARAAYEGRTHIVSGLELLAADLAGLGDASEIVLVLCRMLSDLDVDSAAHAAAGGAGGGAGRSLSMGLHVLREMLDARGAAFVPSDAELAALAALAGGCLESLESAVRMDAVLLCVALHARVGDARFWEALKGVKEDPKSLITYYIVKRQREVGAAGAGQVA